MTEQIHCQLLKHITNMKCVESNSIRFDRHSRKDSNSMGASVVSSWQQSFIGGIVMSMVGHIVGQGSWGNDDKKRHIHQQRGNSQRPHLTINAFRGSVPSQSHKELANFQDDLQLHSHASTALSVWRASSSQHNFFTAGCCQASIADPHLASNSLLSFPICRLTRSSWYSSHVL